ncbi:hypothetical protein [Granulicella arctica]|uniref:hypothetical protein n=1 Tax=Granulicella arctica TaxID=940613 RepID=UPI0021E012A3|nr:hypothetical protein [Granulicella arctica]
MSPLPLPIIAFFFLTVVVALALFSKAVRASKPAILGAILWMGIQSKIALSGFYLVTNTLPPRLILAIVPPVLMIAALFLAPLGHRFFNTMDLKWLVLLHSIRILVEINLYWLFLYKQVPALMTFEAGNVDILFGLTAPLIWWAFSKGHVGRRGLLIWNSLALLSVLNAFVRAMLSAPFRFQQLAFHQPTVAILSFPFILLPAFLVPSVILCHLVIFRKLAGRNAQRP